MYTDLIFDLYGTLVDIHTEENALVWDKTALYFGYYGAPCTGEELHAAFDAAMAQRDREKALCSNACLLAKAIVKNGTPVFRDGAEVLENALFFNRAGMNTRAARNRPFVATIGAHSFYA